MKTPELSIIVICYNMRREAARTLYSLSPSYQEGVTASEYEVIVIDNGSRHRLNEYKVGSLGPNFHYHFYETLSPSPVAAINAGTRMATGKYMALIVDGARMVTPGIIRDTLTGLRAFENAFVCTLGWHLGPEVQNVSMLDGYNQDVEDRLLESIHWQQNGYRLFEISTQAQSSSHGFLSGMPAECSWFALHRNLFIEVGGYNEHFQSPGGGLVNHEFLNRILSHKTVQPAILLGEGSFHQFHGGVATNVKREDHPIEKFKSEYKAIIGAPYTPGLSANPPEYVGHVHPFAERFINDDAAQILRLSLV